MRTGVMTVCLISSVLLSGCWQPRRIPLLPPPSPVITDTVGLLRAEGWPVSPAPWLGIPPRVEYALPPATMAALVVRAARAGHWEAQDGGLQRGGSWRVFLAPTRFVQVYAAGGGTWMFTGTGQGHLPPALGAGLDETVRAYVSGRLVASHP